MASKKYYENKVFESNDRRIQVGKTVMGEPVSYEIIKNISSSIVNNLGVVESDSVLDICCGNGLITELVGLECDKIVGVDVSVDLVGVARESSNIEYHCVDFLNFDLNGYLFNKVFMYEAIQHFKYSELISILNKVFKLDSVELFYIGSIPDIDKRYEMYDSEDKRDFYYSFMEKNQSHIGSWWERGFIKYVCKKLNLEVFFVEQESFLHTSKYRFDVLVTRNDG